jgi:hypothetical protein
MQKQRIQRAAALEMKIAKEGITNAKGEVIKGTALQPTLPNVGMDDDDLAMRAKSKADRAGMSVPMSKNKEFDDSGLYPGARESLGCGGRWDADEAAPPGSYEYDAYNGYPPTVGYDQPYQSGFQTEDYGR